MGGGVGAGPGVMAMRVRTWLTGAHTARVKLLPAEVGAGGARHTLIPQHPDLSGPVAACPWQTWQPPAPSHPPIPPHLPRSSSDAARSAMGGLGI